MARNSAPPVIPLSPYILRFSNSESISLDHPFIDGISGELTLKITNKTPLCIGGQREKKNGQDVVTVKFYREPNSDNISFPGSALKGMLRNTIKQLCFGRMSQVNLAEEAIKIGQDGKPDIKKSTSEILSNINPEHCHTKGNPDLAEMILGYNDVDDHSNSLSSRVTISQFFLEDNGSTPVMNIHRPTALMAPKPKMKPVWKKYAAAPEKTSSAGNNTNILSKLETVAKGTNFIGALRFHNLRPMELGALLWMLSLGDQENGHHQLGTGKPLAFGQVNIKCEAFSATVNNPKYTQLSEQQLKTRSQDQFLTLMNFVSKNVIKPKYDGTQPTWFKTPQYQNFMRLNSIKPHQPDSYPIKKYDLPLTEGQQPAAIKMPEDSLASLVTT